MSRFGWTSSAAVASVEAVLTAVILEEVITELAVLGLIYRSFFQFSADKFACFSSGSFSEFIP
jgi:hypothetical protein